jgi:hypothetical protein
MGSSVETRFLSSRARRTVSLRGIANHTTLRLLRVVMNRSSILGSDKVRALR